MKKIMFNDKYGLTQAVLEGRKTMTRRIVPDGTPLGNWSETVKHSKYQQGEVVAIAQAYKDIIGDILVRDGYETEIAALVYKKHKGWGNKMFVAAKQMVHQIKITDIKVERLKDISREDCMKEGILNHNSGNHRHKRAYPFYFAGGKHSWDNSYSTPRQAFAALIDKVSGKGTWKRNPWVFVYEYELIRKKN